MPYPPVDGVGAERQIRGPIIGRARSNRQPLCAVASADRRRALISLTTTCVDARRHAPSGPVSRIDHDSRVDNGRAAAERARRSRGSDRGPRVAVRVRRPAPRLDDCVEETRTVRGRAASVASSSASSASTLRRRAARRSPRRTGPGPWRAHRRVRRVRLPARPSRTGRFRIRAQRRPAPRAPRPSAAPGTPRRAVGSASTTPHQLRWEWRRRAARRRHRSGASGPSALTATGRRSRGAAARASSRSRTITSGASRSPATASRA